ncbi:hypothetical protein FJW10_29615 [Mesorhizobium sp. B4-1-1]|nr:hypothetical protein FJW10_29615 [Mesorhizobium sp. B4-1-1]
MARELGIGDEVAITATIIKLVDGRASVSIPGYNFPHSITAPAKAKPRDQVELTGEVRRIDEADGMVTIAIGGLITIPSVNVRLVAKYRPPHRRSPLLDKPD